jgi:hypothetical protein
MKKEDGIHNAPRGRNAVRYTFRPGREASSTKNDVSGFQTLSGM